MAHHVRTSLDAVVLGVLHRENIPLDDLVDRLGTEDGAEFLDHHFNFGIVGIADRLPPISDFIIYYNKIVSAIQTKRDQFPGFGEPTTSVLPGAERRGWFQHFQGGSVFWTERFGAHEVHGAIREKYREMGWQASYLGYPTTDELTTHVQGTETRYNGFEGGVISWTVREGAFISLSLNATTEQHQLGAWVHLSGQGFTPGGVIRFAVEGLTGVQGAKSIGLFAIARPDGTFTDVVWDGRTWQAGGAAHMRATDQQTGKSTTAPIPALY